MQVMPPAQGRDGTSVSPMALTLYVQRDAWRSMVDAGFRGYPGLIPVIKGNGYGFGRRWLAEEAIARGAARVAVGTVFELSGLEGLAAQVTVLTPSFDLGDVGAPSGVELTVASDAQLDHLIRHRPVGPVSVKVRTSMLRHGFESAAVPTALDRLRTAGAEARTLSIHPGLGGSDAQRLEEVAALVRDLPVGPEVAVSHLEPHHYSALRSLYPDRSFCIRVGSALWHGDKQVLELRAPALDVRPVRRGDRVGYRGVEVPGDGSVVIVGAGSAHGVQPLANGDSPFHFAQRRLTLLEPPHMHVSMVWIPTGDSMPRPGDEVDVQRPLIGTAVDRIVWR